MQLRRIIYLTISRGDESLMGRKRGPDSRLFVPRQATLGSKNPRMEPLEPGVKVNF